MDSYCTIYVNNKYELKRLVSSINGVVEGDIGAFNSIVYSNFIINFVLNPDYNPLLENVFPDGFLYSRYRMEITFKENVQISYCVEIVSKLLVHLWANGLTAIAAAHYENLLPESGGYKSHQIPWNNDYSP